MTNGGRRGRLDFVGERGAEDERGDDPPAGSHYVIGYGGTVEVPTIDIISTERNVVGNLVGTYNDLDELMNLTAHGLVKLHTAPTRSTPSTTRWPTSTAAGCRVAGILIPEAA